jgi:hypothetical protein
VLTAKALSISSIPRITPNTLTVDLTSCSLRYSLYKAKRMPKPMASSEPRLAAILVADPMKGTIEGVTLVFEAGVVVQEVLATEGAL